MKKLALILAILGIMAGACAPANDQRYTDGPPDNGKVYNIDRYQGDTVTLRASDGWQCFVKETDGAEWFLVQCNKSQNNQFDIVEIRTYRATEFIMK